MLIEPIEFWPVASQLYKKEPAGTVIGTKKWFPFDTDWSPTKFGQVACHLVTLKWLPASLSGGTLAFPGPVYPDRVGAYGFAINT